MGTRSMRCSFHAIRIETSPERHIASNNASQHPRPLAMAAGFCTAGPSAHSSVAHADIDAPTINHRVQLGGRHSPEVKPIQVIGQRTQCCSLIDAPSARHDPSTNQKHCWQPEQTSLAAEVVAARTPHLCELVWGLPFALGLVHRFGSLVSR